MSRSHDKGGVLTKLASGPDRCYVDTPSTEGADRIKRKWFGILSMRATLVCGKAERGEGGVGDRYRNGFCLRMGKGPGGE